jgi:hypothetical protein
MNMLALQECNAMDSVLLRNLDYPANVPPEGRNLERLKRSLTETLNANSLHRAAGESQSKKQPRKSH